MKAEFQDVYDTAERALPLVPICSNPIMFAQDLCHSRIEYLRNAIDVNRKDRAKRFLQSAIRNSQLKISFSGSAGLELYK